MIVIIGGGITGLAAAYELTRRGAPFTLVEASPRAGGLIHTEQLGDFTIEAGPDSVLAQKPAAIALCEELGLADRLIRTTPPRTAFVLKRGRLHALPPRAVLGIPTTWGGVMGYDLLSWRARARLAIEPFVPRRTSTSTADESVAAFFTRRFGSATVPLIAEPLLGGIHAGDVRALSIASLFPRLVDAETRGGSVMRAFRDLPRDTGGAFRSLASGMGELVAALEARLPASSIRYASPAVAIEGNGGRWRVAAAGEALTSDAVIITAPAYAAGRLLTGVDPEAASLCSEVPYASTASVALAWPRAAIRHPLAGSGFVVARRYSPQRITACTWVSSKWEGRAPEGSALLRAFIGGAADPDAVDLSDAELIGIAARDLAPVLGITGSPMLARVYRWRRAGAQHNVGQLARMARLDARLAAHPGLYVAGSGFRAVGIPDCVADGRAVAAAAAGYAGRN